MSLDEVLASPEWAFALAAGLGSQFGEDRILSVGTARDDSTEVETSEEPIRTLALPFTTADGHRGAIEVELVAPFAEALERTSPDEILLSACTAAFEAGRAAIAEQAVVDVVAAAAYERQDDPDADDDDDDVVVYPLLDGSDAVGAVTLRVGSDRVAETVGPEPGANPAAAPDAGVVAASGASYVLADVEMGVTAELGRCRMTMRELLSITPGAVIDLDRAAGAPVDVLVNGTLIARGEVVVVDEEFGIRISELVPQPAAAR